MPIYEYLCAGCQKRVEVLVLSRDALVRCPRCGCADLERLMSPFAYHRSEADRLAGIDTSRPQSEDYYKDDRNIGLWAKKRLKELGHDPGPEFEGIIEKAKKKVKDELSG
ncbi:MAG: FmdB family zinc ribbon protein [Desulfotomaculales bacterium]